MTGMCALAWPQKEGTTQEVPLYFYQILPVV